LLRKPAPWDLLSIYKRDFYIKIHDWLTQNEEVNDLDDKRSIPERDQTGTINTAKVASEILQLLKINGITHAYFASQKLKIFIVVFEELVFNPKPYADLKESERRIFRCMKKWTDPEKVNDLKRDYDSYVAIYQNYNKTSPIEVI
jgi:hypothetical protein